MKRLRLPGSGACGVLAAAAVLASTPGVARATRVLEYQAQLQPEPPLRQPVSLSLDPETGALCVTDDASRCLAVFDRMGFDRFRTDATSSISWPLGGCVDRNGDFVFTDVEDGYRTIRRLNFLGEPVEYVPERPAPDWAPRHLALARNGDYVTLDRRALLARHTPEGALVWSVEVIGADFEGRDLLGAPAEEPDGTLLVPGATLGRVIRVSADGKLQGGFGVPGTKRGELAFPSAVAVGPGGDVLVLDRMRHTVLIYDRNHEFLQEYGRVGFRPGQLYYPLAILASPDGRVFISQGYRGRVQIFRLFDTADAMTLPEGPGSARTP